MKYKISRYGQKQPLALVWDIGFLISIVNYFMIWFGRRLYLSKMINWKLKSLNLVMCKKIWQEIHVFTIWKKKNNDLVKSISNDFFSEFCYYVTLDIQLITLSKNEQYLDPFPTCSQLFDFGNGPPPRECSQLYTNSHLAFMKQ